MCQLLGSTLIFTSRPGLACLHVLLWQTASPAPQPHRQPAALAALPGCLLWAEAGSPQQRKTSTCHREESSPRKDLWESGCSFKGCAVVMKQAFRPWQLALAARLSALTASTEGLGRTKDPFLLLVALLAEGLWVERENLKGMSMEEHR